MTPSFPSINIHRVRDLIVAFARLQVRESQRGSLMFLSAPGYGKTQGVHAAGRILGADVVTLVASLIDRLDLAGIPFVERQDEVTVSAGGAEVLSPEGVSRKIPLTKWAANELVAGLSKELNPNGKPTILYLNEVNAAPESVMPVLFRLVNSGERRIGNLTLRDNVVVVGDGNPACSNSVGRDLPEAFKRRFAIFHVGLDFNGWKQWATSGGVDNDYSPCAVPATFPAPVKGIDGRILGFFELNQNARHLSDFDPSKRERWQYSSPASWEKLSQHLPILDILNDEEVLPFCASFIGAEAGADFTAFLRSQSEIENMSQILSDPTRYPLPEKADHLAFLCGVAANRAQMGKEHIVKASLLACRMIEGVNVTHSCADFGAMLAGMLFRNPEIRPKIMADRESLDRIAAAVKTQPHLRKAIMG